MLSRRARDAEKEERVEQMLFNTRNYVDVDIRCKEAEYLIQNWNKGLFKRLQEDSLKATSLAEGLADLLRYRCSVRVIAARSLGTMGAMAICAFEDLLQSLEHASTSNCDESEFLGAASWAVDRLAEALNECPEQDQHNKTKVANALAKLLDEGHANATRTTAVRSLGTIGPVAVCALPELLRSLENAKLSQEFFDVAIWALDRLAKSSVFDVAQAMLMAMQRAGERALRRPIQFDSHVFESLHFKNDFSIYQSITHYDPLLVKAFEQVMFWNKIEMTPVLVKAFEDGDTITSRIATTALEKLICDAARRGDLTTCSLMVQLGAPVLSMQHNPGTVAEKAGHGHVADYFANLQKTDRWLCGSGSAYFPAMRDEHVVEKAEWYVVPLGGAAGLIGAKHSLVVLKVASGRMYVLEKAVVPNNQDEQFKNDVLTSWWEDVLGILQHQRPLHITCRPANSDLMTPDTITMTTLHKVAVDLGAYNVASCNCHHSALAVFNYCAKQFFHREISTSEMPNDALSRFAGIFSYIGVDFATSASSTSTETAEGVQTSILSCRQPSQGIQSQRCLVQNSFASEDGSHVAKYRDVVNQHVPSFEMCSLLPAGVDDKTWSARWGHQLQASHAAFVVFSEIYRQKCAGNPQAPLMKEAALLIRRVYQDPSFQVHVLDPGVPAEDPNQLRRYLTEGLSNENYDVWRTFVTREGVEKTEVQQFPSQVETPVTASAFTPINIRSMSSIRMHLLTSFAPEDKCILGQYLTAMDTRVPGWKSCQLLPPGPDRLQQWKQQLGICSGILVLFTGAYKSQFTTYSELMLEAEAIWKRTDDDPTFKVFVLDPAKAGQGPHNLRFYLQDGEKYMNLEQFRSFFDESTACHEVLKENTSF